MMKFDPDKIVSTMVALPMRGTQLGLVFCNKARAVRVQLMGHNSSHGPDMRMEHASTIVDPDTNASPAARDFFNAMRDVITGTHAVPDEPMIGINEASGREVRLVTESGILQVYCTRKGSLHMRVAALDRGRRQDLDCRIYSYSDLFMDASLNQQRRPLPAAHAAIIDASIALLKRHGSRISPA